MKGRPLHWLVVYVAWSRINFSICCHALKYEEQTPLLYSSPNITYNVSPGTQPYRSFPIGAGLNPPRCISDNLYNAARNISYSSSSPDSVVSQHWFLLCTAFTGDEVRTSQVLFVQLMSTCRFFHWLLTVEETVSECNSSSPSHPSRPATRKFHS